MAARRRVVVRDHTGADLGVVALPALQLSGESGVQPHAPAGGDAVEQGAAHHRMGEPVVIAVGLGGGDEARCGRFGECVERLVFAEFGCSAYRGEVEAVAGDGSLLQETERRGGQPADARPEQVAHPPRRNRCLDLAALESEHPAPRQRPQTRPPGVRRFQKATQPGHQRLQQPARVRRGGVPPERLRESIHATGRTQVGDEQGDDEPLLRWGPDPLTLRGTP